jgi:6,7-dimethyl-8-ribityllumazine synthase
MKGVTNLNLSGQSLKITIVHTRWNTEIVQSLVNSCQSTLSSLGCSVTLHSVPGAFELPLACQFITTSPSPPDAVIAIGCLIKGETMHFEYISDATSQALMQLGLKTNVPVIFGVLTCLNEEQARV